MKKYAVAIVNDYEGTAKVKIVKAENESDAVIIAVEGKLEKDIIPEEIVTAKEIVAYYAECDLIVSEPVEI